MDKEMDIRIVGGKSIREIAPLLETEDELYIVYDENVAWVASELAGAARACIAIEALEAEKSMDTVLAICRELLEAGASRRALVLAVGGGITTDMAGFAASIYKRGIRYANLPTTLLAQVDAALGGKTGVNLDGYKNMLGVIVQPQFTFLTPEVLKTLPDRDWRSGVAELLKTFLIADADTYAHALTALREGGDLGELLLRAARIKADIVRRDPYEKDERRVLNLGHSFAHAIEAQAFRSGMDITHGEAVSMGLVQAAALADRLGISESPLEERLRTDLASVGLPTDCPFPAEQIVEVMDKDKKAANGKVAFVLPVRPGKVVIQELTPNTLLP